MDGASSFIAMDRRHALATGRDRPERDEGAALFADISGFTRLTDGLARSLAQALDLPEADDLCEGSYELDVGHDADWSATCESGQKIEARVFLNEGGISISAVGKDGQGRTFGFFPKPGEG